MELLGSAKGLEIFEGFRDLKRLKNTGLEKRTLNWVAWDIYKIHAFVAFIQEK